MATKTNYLNLSKAEVTDEILKTLTANNNNFDILDAKAQEIDGKITEIEENVGSAEGIIVLEASTDNVIDFDTLTESGVYLIKNLNPTTSLNTPITDNTAYYDVVLSVTEVRNSETNEPVRMYQRLMYNNFKSDYTRYYTYSDNNWRAWNYMISASHIETGTLSAGMKCATPTEDTHIANKAYVDSVVGSGGGSSSDSGITVLEASTDNVIDFNTLTEPGVYLIKNVTTTTATNVYFSTGSTYPLDVFLEVTTHSYSSGTAIYQRLDIQNTVLNYTRTYNTSGTWSNWSNSISPGFISAGTFSGKMLAHNSAVSDLGAAQVRNISITANDVTAGEYSLTTGNILLVYE